MIVIDERARSNNVADYFFSDTGGLDPRDDRGALFILSELAGVVGRRRHDIYTDNLVLVALKLVGFAAVAFGADLLGEQGAGFPVASLLVIVLLVFWTLIAERTTFGRHVYAVGGTPKRRAAPASTSGSSGSWSS